MYTKAPKYHIVKFRSAQPRWLSEASDSVTRLLRVICCGLTPLQSNNRFSPLPSQTLEGYNGRLRRRPP